MNNAITITGIQNFGATNSGKSCRLTAVTDEGTVEIEFATNAAMDLTSKIL